MTSTSGIYNKSGRESIKKASVETYDNQQMPDELAAFHAFHLDSRVDSIENEQEGEQNGIGHTKKEFDQLETPRLADRQSSHKHEDKDSDTDDEEVRVKRNKKQRVMFTKLVKSRLASEWEDIGSQTDHSDMSEGHYSDETSEEKNKREFRNKTKSEKRILRLAAINEKHNIAE